MTEIQHKKQELVRCLVGLHVYIPAYEVRQEAANGPKEFRYKCSCCHRKTTWRPWQEFEKFSERHNPNWMHSRGRLTPVPVEARGFA